MNSNDITVNSVNTVAEVYSKPEIILDTFLLLLAAWSEVGYAIFTGHSTSESILDPLKRYLYPSISVDIASSITQSLEITTQALSYADAGFTILTVLNMRKKRKKFIKEMRSGFNQLKGGEIKFIPFLLNLLMFMLSFTVISLSPWTGLKMKNFNSEFSLAGGSTMFLGQMAVLLFQYSAYIFSTPKSIMDFISLSRSEKKNILHCIFCSRKGLALVLRSLANMATMGMRFRGISLFSNKYLLGNTALFQMIYSAMAPVSIVYRVLMAQSLNDYKSTFSLENNNPSGEVVIEAVSDSTPRSLFVHRVNQNCLNSHLTRLLLVLLGGLIGMTFLLRMFSTPVLFTGPVDHPESNYDVKNTLLGCLGLLLGGFASYQYCRFMWHLGKNASKSLLSSRFFRSGNRSVSTAGSSIVDTDQDSSCREIEKAIVVGHSSPQINAGNRSDL